MKILVVDDAKISRMIITKSLIKLGFIEDDVIETNNGQEAYEYLSDESVDLLITDLSMPEMDGIELLTKIKFDMHNIIRIVISGTISENKQEKLDHLNVDAVIKKPYTLKKIELVLDELGLLSIN